MAKDSKKHERRIVELGYRPRDKLNTSNPPRGGSGITPPPPRVIILKNAEDTKSQK